MADDLNDAMKSLEREGHGIAARAFRKAVGNVEAVAKTLAPVGHYGRSRGKRDAKGRFIKGASPGRAGGDLRQSLRAEFIGRAGNDLTARLSSALPYAQRQHEEEFHHPGKYTGAPGKRYAAKYWERAVEVVFGSGDDPLGQYAGPAPAGFQELLEEEGA